MLRTAVLRGARRFNTERLRRHVPALKRGQTWAATQAVPQGAQTAPSGLQLVALLGQSSQGEPTVASGALAGLSWWIE